MSNGGPELWDIEDIARYLGIKPASAHKELWRRGIRAVSRQPGRGGRNLYPKAVICEHWPDREQRKRA